MTCPCGRPTLSPPLCFYCASGTSEAAQAEIRDAKRLAPTGDWRDPLTGCPVKPGQFTLIADEAGNLFCFPGMWKRAGKGATIAVFRLSSSGRWTRRDCISPRSEPCPEVMEKGAMTA